MADGAASVPLLLGAGLLVGAACEAAVGFVAIRIDEDAETSAVLAGPARRLVIVLALALAASLLAEQLAVDEGVADLVGVGITTNWGTLRWARNLVVLTAALLWRAHEAIIAQRSTPLSIAISFLHREYQPHMWWWELVEMVRRLLLIGLMQIMVDSGSALQIILGTVFSVVFLLDGEYVKIENEFVNYSQIRS